MRIIIIYDCTDERISILLQHTHLKYFFVVYCICYERVSTRVSSINGTKSTENFSQKGMNEGRKK